MTEDELKRIEDEGCGCVMASGYGCAAEALVAEVRRLRGLIAQANCDGWRVWCSNTVREKPLERDPVVHDADCPALTESGDVR